MAEATEEIARVSQFVLTGLLRPGNLIFMTFKPGCSAQMFPEYSDLLLRLFFFNIQKAKQTIFILSLFVHQNTTYKNAKISPLPPKVNIVHLMSILLNF